MGTNLLSAIDNFETTMQFASDFEATPKYADALLDAAVDQSADYLAAFVIKEVPGTEEVVTAIKAVHAEAKRAAEAQSSHRVGAWIRAERAVVSNYMTDAREGDLQTSVAIKEAILQDLCSLQDSGGDLNEAIMGIAAAQGELGAVPTEQAYRRALFEDWINASFEGVEAEGKSPGTVHVFWPVGVDGDPNDYSPGEYPLVFDSEKWSASVSLPGPYGERVAGGLNELRVRPLDVRVVKKVCFETDGVAGGIATYCGALEPDGRERFSPGVPWAVQAFRTSTWREGTSSFRE
jgi:hypothetical protein